MRRERQLSSLMISEGLQYHGNNSDDQSLEVSEGIKTVHFYGSSSHEYWAPAHIHKSKCWRTMLRVHSNPHMLHNQLAAHLNCLFRCVLTLPTAFQTQNCEYDPLQLKGPAEKAGFTNCSLNRKFLQCIFMLRCMDFNLPYIVHE